MSSTYIEKQDNNGENESGERRDQMSAMVVLND
jgi:hypothetical protein